MFLLSLGLTSLVLYLGLLGVKADLSLRIAQRELQGMQDQETITIVQPILSGDPLLEKALQHNLNVKCGNARATPSQ